MTLANKIAFTCIAVLLGVVLYGSMALRHAFVEMHNHTSTNNAIINSFDVR